MLDRYFDGLCLIVGVGQARVICRHCGLGATDKFGIFRVGSHVAACLFDAIVQETKKSWMGAGSIVQEYIECRSHELGSFVFDFKRVCFTPGLFAAVRKDGAETPVPNTAFQGFVYIIHTPAFRGGKNRFCS